MIFGAQVPRNALAWIIITQFAILIPHLLRTPIWVLAIYLGAALWRSMIYQGRWSFPGRFTKLALTITGFGGVGLSYQTLIGLEPTVTLLLIAYALKLVELVNRRDAYMVIFIAYFVCVTQFLFSQELLVTGYMLVAVLLNTTALIALHQPGQDRLTLVTLRRATVMLTQAFPLMILLFFVFPRIGPLWSVPLKTNAAKTGVSDSMTPGDIASLGRNDEVAFRVQFQGKVPPRRELYWRGMVFSRLVDGTWRSLKMDEIPFRERRPREPEWAGRPITYSIVMEPTQQNWLYTLPFAESPGDGILQANDFRLVAPIEIQDEMHFEVESWPGAKLEPELSLWRKEVETTLPTRGNPRTRALARLMFDEAGNDPARFAQDVLDMFAEQSYFYTLRPPRLSGDRMDQFLFETRRGFCEHYAAAFTWMMREAGVPARVVAGYQGGEINPVNGAVIVHQFDAHAWAEIWLQGEGWTRVDPTGAIAPSRVEYGLEEALQEEGSFLENSPLSPLRFRGVDWINTLRLRLDAVNYSWQLFVLRFDNQAQYELLDKLFGEIDRTRLVATILVVWGLLLSPVVFLLVWRRRPRAADPATRAYLNFCGKLQKIGLGRAPDEAPGAFARRVSAARPELAAEVSMITRTYEALAYRGGGDRGEDGGLALLRRHVRRFKPGGLGSLRATRLRTLFGASPS